ncbi:MAG: hypothetical protein EOP13_20590 [Pseudomonas sp.]|uniref:hypothetical protein n=1 Tax=Pseudomonas sp. TaxID=306 RepID=UPI00121A27E7|nr:hypothetical protein [Pseudomonas sp.]RZI70585.1 MAG: hypothetical protein EOP13_20590 [Pseudomonas sp.]
MKTHQRQLKWLLIGAVCTPFALGAAIASGGAGHGDYLFAKCLFPYTMLLTSLTGTITYPLIGLALVQFPLYGLAAGSFNATRTLVFLLVLHTIGAFLCFSSLLPNFGK